MLFGGGLRELIAKEMGEAEQGEKAEDSVTVFKDPSVDSNIVIAATIVLVIAGIIAGYVPAKRAVKIKPIEALRG